MPGGQNYLAHGIDFIQFLSVCLQQAVTFRRQFDLPLFRFGRLHVFSLADLAQHLRRIIFMEHSFLLFPHIQMLLSYREKHRDILFGHHMTFPEHGVLYHSRNNLRNIMAEHAAHRILGSDQLHSFLLSFVSNQFFA